MEHKHFSHKHGLILHQIPQGSELTCFGCHFPCTGTIYVCWECRYFLHDQCFKATRAMNHPSHPMHPLTLVPYPTYPSSNFYCNACSLIGTGFSYSCSTCEFDVHVHCAYMPNNTTQQPHNPSQNHVFNQVVQTPSPPLGYPIPTNNTIPTFPNQNPGVISPHFNASLVQTTGSQVGYHGTNNVPTKMPQTASKEIKHFSHPDHPLIPCNIGHGDRVICSCCEKEICPGSAYKCTKTNCNFYLTKACFNLPSEIRHKSHPHHSLKLLARSTYQSGGFTCDVCHENGRGFTYHCFVCDFDSHVFCAFLPETSANNGGGGGGSSGNSAADVQQQRLEMLQIMESANLYI